MAVMIAGRQFWLWRAVDDEGEVLDLLVQRRRDKAAAVKLMRKLLKKQGFAPAVLVPTSFALTAQQGPRSDCRRAMSRGYGRTIGPRIRINRRDHASVRCNVSNRPDQPSASCPFTPPFTTRSTSNAISHSAASFVS
jgi:transposase-like protein